MQPNILMEKIENTTWFRKEIQLYANPGHILLCLPCITAKYLWFRSVFALQSCCQPSLPPNPCQPCRLIAGEKKCWAGYLKPKETEGTGDNFQRVQSAPPWGLHGTARTTVRGTRGAVVSGGYVTVVGIWAGTFVFESPMGSGCDQSAYCRKTLEVFL